MTFAEESIEDVFDHDRGLIERPVTNTDFRGRRCQADASIEEIVGDIDP